MDFCNLPFVSQSPVPSRLYTARPLPPVSPMDLCPASFLPQGSQSTPCQTPGTTEEVSLQTMKEVVTSQDRKKVTSMKFP